MAICSCIMATGKVRDLGLGMWPTLHVSLVCDYSAAEVAYVAIVAQYKYNYTFYHFILFVN